MSLAAGDLRHRVTIERPTRTQDATTGAVSTGWVAFGTFWASVTPLSGRERMAAATEFSHVTTRIKLRHVSGIDATMRAVYRSALYNIQAVTPDPQSGREWLTLFCSEGAGDGR